MLEYQYRLIDGAYVLHKGEEPIGRPLQGVAMAFDGDDGVLFKHGCPQVVQSWYDKTRSKLLQAASHSDAPTDLLAPLKIVTGPIPLNELNKCITITGYIKSFAARFLSENPQIEAENGQG